MEQTSVNWAAEAKRLLEAGETRRGRPWEAMLDQHLREFFPQLVKEMGRDYQDYLLVKVNEALDLQSEMMDQGADPFRAREQAIEFLLPNPLTLEQEAEEEQEEQEALADMASALKRQLEKR